MYIILIIYIFEFELNLKETHWNPIECMQNKLEHAKQDICCSECYKRINIAWVHSCFESEIIKEFLFLMANNKPFHGFNAYISTSHIQIPDIKKPCYADVF